MPRLDAYSEAPVSLRSPRGVEVLLISLAFLVVHLARAASVAPIEDEAYYALWASAPALGYYDHPPMIAWSIWLGVEAVGLHPLGLRLVPVLMHVTAGVMVWDLARCLTGRGGAALWALVFFHASPLLFLLAGFATPDAPSVFFWTGAVWATGRAALSGRAHWWVLAGALAGAGLLSKLTNVFLLVGLLGWLVGTRAGRAHFVKPGPWIALAAVICVASPYIFWNVETGGLGFERQLSRVKSAGVDLLGPVLFLVMTLLLVSPGIAGLALRAASQPRAPGVTLLVASSLPLLIYFAYHATHSEVSANWQAPLHPAFAVLAAMGAAGLRPAFRRGSAAMGFAIGLLVLGLLFLPRTPLFTSHTPPNQVRGWGALTQELWAELDQLGDVWIATASYGLTGHLWYYFPERDVWAVDQLQRYGFRGGTPGEFCQRPALLVLRGDRDFDPGSVFQSVTHLGTKTRRSGRAVLFTYELYAAKGAKFDGCP